jgi:hypothetical protein
MSDPATPDRHRLLTVILAWLVVGAPLLWGVARTLDNAAKLFR